MDTLEEKNQNCLKSQESILKLTLHKSLALKIWNLFSLIYIHDIDFVPRQKSTTSFETKKFSKPVSSLLSGVWYPCVLDFSKTLNLKLLMAPSTLSHYEHMFWEWNWVRESGNEHGLGIMTQRTRDSISDQIRGV